MKTKRSTNEFHFLDLFERFIAASKSGKRLQPNGKTVSRGTIENYTYTLALLNAFCKEKSFKMRVRPVRYLAKRQLAQEKNYWKRFYTAFTNYLYNDCGHFDNYVGQTIKNLRVVFNYCNKDLLLGIGDFHKLFYVCKEDVPIIALLPEELNFLIYDKNFEENLSTKMKKVKDFLVFGCTVALRFSDLLQLKHSNLRSVNNTIYLAVKSKKTGTETSIRLPDYAREIIKRNKQKKGMLLPRFNKTNLNIYVKRLCSAAGFTQPVVKEREKRGKATVFKAGGDGDIPDHRFCDLITTHTMRRTAITTMLCLGVPEQIVRKISGHSPVSKDFFRYVLLAQSYQDQETMRMFERLSEKKLVG